MSVDVSAGLLVAFLLALVRTSAWVAVVPIFGARTVPGQVKGAIAVALALPVAPRLAGHTPALDAGSLVTAVGVQAAAGLALGFVTLLLFSVFQAAGQLMDIFGGFAMSSYFDPLTGQSNSVFGRFHHMVALTLLFASGGYLIVVHGLLSSFDAVPMNTDPLAALARLVTHDFGTFFVAALQIAGPLLAVLVLADAGMGLLTKAAPTLNVFSLGFPLKILVALVLVGGTLTAMPGALDSIIDRIMGSTDAVAGIFAGGG